MTDRATIEALREEWRAVSGFEGRYEISNGGRVRSLTFRDMHGNETVRMEPRVLRPAPTSRGYLTVNLTAFGQRRTALVHHLVAESFIGQKPKGLHCAHLNGNKTDNRSDNLAYVTPAENERHKVAHGTKAIGSRQGAAKLTEEQVRQIRARHAPGKGATLAREYGVSQSTISSIIRGQWWRAA